jgi:hypothetical protein
VPTITDAVEKSMVLLAGRIRWTWHVKSRAIWLQPYFESGFPYGQDQFISAAGTAWVALALTAAIEPVSTTLQQ